MNILLNQIIDSIDDELNHPEVRDKINNKIIKPLVFNIVANTQHYFTTIISLYGVVLFLQILILILIYTKK
jgi:hypothetical protein